MTQRTRLFLLASGPFGVIALWIAVYEAGIFNRALLPGFFETVEHLGKLIWTGNILKDFKETILRMGIGFGLAAVAGIAIGLIIGYSVRVYTALEIPLEFFRSLPVTTLYPLFVLVFGIGSKSKIAMITVACVFVVILNTAYGVLHRKPVRGQVADLFGATRWQLFKEVIFWEALPQILIGLRVALSYALIVAIVTEMFMGTQNGLGQRVFEAYNTYYIVELYAIILLVGLTGYGLNRLFVLLERHLVHWIGKGAG